MKIDRHMGIISYLMDHQKTTAKELAETFQVNRRTIMRDIDDLTIAGIPLYCKKGKNGGIYLMDAVDMNKPPLSITELMSIETSLKSRMQVLDDDATFNAILKLNKMEGIADFEIDLSLSKGNTELRKLVLDLLSAIRNNQLIYFDYMNAQGEESNKTAEPYRIVFKDRSWYMDAYCYSTERFNVYKLARIANLSTRGTFSKRDYEPISYNGGEWMEKDKIPVTLLVNKVVIDRFLELLGRENVKKVDDSWYSVLYPLKDNVYGYNTLLGYGKFVRVISPNTFLNHFITYIDEVKDVYQYADRNNT
ncbi:transcriptional regulator [Bacillus sp. J14TS2]|uniref:helix-turn-helix transcriptional regulator n=1 Tax=Bacillus sp. J14TS2 TaxID=2807188 RepID=UPI001B079447|nr:YafY family protein [Bacillus sp. J14TS2]GIN73370.1 transcriptional regulator [Bacillus sp. J14TS2]